MVMLGGSISLWKVDMAGLGCAGSSATTCFVVCPVERDGLPVVGWHLARRHAHRLQLEVRSCSGMRCLQRVRIVLDGRRHGDRGDGNTGKGVREIYSRLSIEGSIYGNVRQLFKMSISEDIKIRHVNNERRGTCTIGAWSVSLAWRNCAASRPKSGDG